MPSETRQDTCSTHHATTEHDARTIDPLLGKFAASLGHEFNNPLGYVCSSVEYCKNYLTQLHKQTQEDAPLDANMLRSEFAQLLEALTDAQEGLARMNAIMHQLQNFTQLREVHLAPIHLDMLIHSIIKRAHAEGMQIHYESAHPDLHVTGDAILLTHALEQLLHNAWRAITSKTDCAHDTISISTTLEQGRIWISITDQGAGMNEELHSKILEPFVTTHASEGHTGLGLTLVHQIVLAHRGNLLTRSTPGKGTCISIELECLDSSEHLEPPTQERTLTQENTVEEDEEWTQPERLSILLVSHSQASRKEFSQLLGDEFTLYIVADANEALTWITTQTYTANFILYDEDCTTTPHQDFVALLPQKQKRHVGIVMSSIPDLSARQRASREGMTIFARPLRARAFTATIQALIKSLTH